MHVFEDVRSKLVRRGDPRTPERLWAHYELEVRLAERLKQTPREERARVYNEVYDELFETIYDHSQFRAKGNDLRLRRRFNYLRRYLKPGMSFVEIGAGDGRLSKMAMTITDRVAAVDVSDKVVDGVDILISNGTDIPLPSGSVDLAYSCDLLEHLHPEDAPLHVAEVRRILTPGGIYLCATPNRHNGPHDISRMLDPVARGLHLKEYTFREVADLMLGAGMKRVRFDIVRAGHRVPHPVPMLAHRLPGRLRSLALMINAVARA